MSVYDSDLGRRKLKPLADVNYFREYSLNDKDVSTIMTHMINEDLEVTPTILNISGTDYTMTRISLPCLVTETEGSDWFSFGDTLYCTGIFTNNATGKTAASVIPYEKLYELTEYVNHTIEVLQINSPQDEITAWVESNTWKLVIRLNRLSPGPVVAKSATRQLRKLTTEEQKDDSIIGTWVFNDYINEPDIGYDYYKMPAEFKFYFIDDLGNQIECDRITVYRKSLTPFFGVSVHKPETYYSTTIYSRVEDWVEEYYKTIYIVENTLKESFITWLKANATKIA